MLPNSRMIPPKNIRTRSNSETVASSSSAYELNSGQQQQHKKGFISRLLSNPNIAKDYPSRPKYESVLGIHNKEDYATYGKPIDTNKVNYLVAITTIFCVFHFLSFLDPSSGLLPFVLLFLENLTLLYKHRQQEEGQQT